MLSSLRKVARGESTIDYVGRAKLWFTISAGIMLVSLLGLLFVRLNLGLAFKGGTSMRAPLATSASVADFRSALEPLGISGEIQISEGPPPERKREVLVQSKHLEPSVLAEAQSAIAKIAGQEDVNLVSVDDVGPKWGRQVSNKALQGLIVFILLVVLYISVRFEPKMGAAAVVALFHDLIATAGVYAIVGFEVSPATVVALLTILGYSLYDTVVIFDKVKENAATLVGGRNTYSGMVNQSLNEVTMRSINTSLTSLIPVAALLIVGQTLVGADQLKDLALALFIGILIGTYSSIFLAAPLLAVWKEREPRYQALKIRARKEGGGKAPAFAAATPSSSMAMLDDDVEMPAAPSTPTARPARPNAPGRPVSARARKKRRAKRKR